MRKILVLIFLSLSIHLAVASESILCNACTSTVQWFKSMLQSEGAQVFVKALWMFICSGSHVESYCEGMNKNIVRQVHRAAVDIFVAEEICTKLLMCTEFRYIEDPLKEFLTKSTFNSPPLIDYEKPASEVVNPIKLLVVTDIHIDYGYQEGKVTECSDNICCRKASLDPKGNEPRAGKFGFLGKCDIPLITAQSFAEYALKNAKPDAVLFLGDTPAHDMWEQTRTNFYRGLSEFVGLLRQFEVPVYPVLGNHEGYPLDNFEFKKNGAHQWAVDQTLEIWGDLLTGEMKTTFRQNGCYSTLMKGTNLRILALTSFAQLSDNVYLWADQNNPANVVCFF
eukprot:TRINITY_DN1919_c0_g2_i5.p2 TRINITY_DN1919_c0_g2~~TRINITY_DN1919_c0_g2_i5.p2  ORF type:complete len:338 (-),score=57.37 TRINITY_DN1919_c0_g2_i5:790-1803(-)